MAPADHASHDLDQIERATVADMLSTNVARDLDTNMNMLQVPEALLSLADILRDPGASDRLRRRAASALGGIGTAPARDVLIEVLEKTEQPAFGDGRELWSRVLDALALCVERESEEELLKDLEHENPEMRWLAAMQLGKKKHTPSVSKLIYLLDDPHPDPRLGATWALGEIQEDKGINELIAIVEKRRGGGNRVSAIEAMGKVGTTRAIDAIRSVKSDDPCFRMAEKTLSTIQRKPHE